MPTWANGIPDYVLFALPCLNCVFVFMSVLHGLLSGTAVAGLYLVCIDQDCI